MLHILSGKVGGSYRLSILLGVVILLFVGASPINANAQDKGFDLGRETKSLKLKKRDLPGVEGAKFAAVRGRIKKWRGQDAFTRA